MKHTYFPNAFFAFLHNSLIAGPILLRNH